MTIITFNIQDITYSLSSVVCSVRHQVLSCDKMPYTTRARPHFNRSCTLASVAGFLQNKHYFIFSLNNSLYYFPPSIWDLTNRWLNAQKYTNKVMGSQTVQTNKYTHQVRWSEFGGCCSSEVPCCIFRPMGYIRSRQLFWS